MKIKTIADLTFDIRLTEIESFEDCYLQFEDNKYYLKTTFNHKDKKIKDGQYTFHILLKEESKKFSTIDSQQTLELYSKSNNLSKFIYYLSELLNLLLDENKEIFLDRFIRINDFEYEIKINQYYYS